MALVAAKSSSNAAKPTGENDVITGDAAKLGFTVFSDESLEPATSNSQIPTVKAVIAPEQEGTSLGSYQYQKDMINAKSPGNMTGQGKQ